MALETTPHRCYKCPTLVTKACALDPGRHVFCSESENQDAIAFTVEAGKTYYLQQLVKMGTWKAHTKLALLDDDKGKKNSPI